MTPQQALQLLMQISEQASVPKAAHIQAEHAAHILNRFIVEKTEKKDEK